ncbi:MAG: RtcB family protein [Polyangiaceae bacterium]|nr:RtcB family protein [Polyangiaceae bacterium]
MNLQRISEFLWKIPRSGRMRVPGLVVASKALIEGASRDRCLEQVANVAQLPGIEGHSLAMPDIHWGYGFPIGGVAAFREQDGVVSPGGVGYDINCGVRLLRSRLHVSEVKSRAASLASALERAIPSGVGTSGQLELSHAELDQVMRLGARWAVSAGFGRSDDLEVSEEGGCFDGADPAAVSDRARERGRCQLGSLGSGNHFLELGHVTEVFDQDAARAFGLTVGSVTVLIHSGSRGLGHQICDDHLRAMLGASEKYGIELPDRQLCAAPLSSPEARHYLGAMACAVNFAFANRQLLTDAARTALGKALGHSDTELGLELVADVCHNIAKWETHEVEGRKARLCVHRKGATRSFPKGHPLVSPRYREVGQPVLVPGDMGRASYVLVGTELCMKQTFGSSCHGAGRQLSRKQAKKTTHLKQVLREMESRGIFVRSHALGTVAEEVPDAYKNVADVVDVVEGAGLGRKVVRLEPLAVVKG